MLSSGQTAVSKANLFKTNYQQQQHRQQQHFFCLYIRTGDECLISIHKVIDMVTRLEMTENFAYKLAESTRKERKKLLKNATEEQLKGLFEICLNVIRGNLTMKPVEFQRFKRRKNTLTALASKKVPMYKKRRIVNQKGGFLSSVATFALPLLAQLIQHGIARKQNKR